MLGGDSEYLIFNIDQNKFKILILHQTQRALLLNPLFRENLGFLYKFSSKVGVGGAFVGCFVCLYLPVSKLQRTDLEFSSR